MLLSFSTLAVSTAFFLFVGLIITAIVSGGWLMRSPLNRLPEWLDDGLWIGLKIFLCMLIVAMGAILANLP